jgi:hypothetical protein
MFRHHPDGFIYLNQICFPLAFFQQQEPDYALPAGAIAQEHQPGLRVLRDGSSQWTGELPWEEGDRYLSQLETYRLAWEAANAPPPLLPQPDWENLAAQFQFPGNALYGAIAAQVAVSGFAAQDHWSNFKLMLLTPSQRSPQTLAAGMNYLVWLLTMAGQPVSPTVTAEWNRLLLANNFPSSCLIG